MLVRDVYDDAQEVLGYCQESVLFSRLTDAIEVLANKGQWEPLQGYVDIRVQNSRLVTLPREIEAPIKIKINGNPAFSRSRLFEFSMNALTDDMVPVGWAWEEQGTVPVNVQPATPRKIRATGNAADNDKIVRLKGWDADGKRIEDDLVIGGANLSANTYARIDIVVKDTTQFPVHLETDNGNGVADYAAVETSPQYRQIRLTKDAGVVRMLFRRVTYKVTSLDDFIPLHSKMAIVLMLKSLESYRKSQPDASDLETAALKFITEEQSSRNIAREIADATEEDGATGDVYRSNSIIIVSDIWDDASQVFGQVGRAKLYDRISDSIKLLSAKANWDSLLAYLDIRVLSGNRVVLPDDVEVPISININDQPSFARDRYFEFTLNTPGTTMQDTAGFTWDDRGNTPIFAILDGPSRIAAMAENNTDFAKTIRIYGIDAKNQPLVDNTGALGLPIAFTAANAPVWSLKRIKRIDRVDKPVTVGFVELRTLQPKASQDGLTTTLARYYPQETDPSYRVIKLSQSAAAVRMLYRRKTNLVRNPTDIIPLSSRHALSMAMRAVATGLAGKDDPKTFEDAAVRYHKEEEDARNSMSISDELTPTNQTYNNRDSIIVADLYDDATKIFGMVGRDKLFDRMTESIEALANKGQWDGMVGYVDIVTDRSFLVTLPRYVETPLAINVGGRPMIPRNQFFEFHLNGPGSECGGSCRHWDQMGEAVTFRDPPGAYRLVAIPDAQADVGKKITIYGYDERSRPVRSRGSDGALVNMEMSGIPGVDSPIVRRIERVVKDRTVGFVSLYAYVPLSGGVGGQLYKIGYYYPDETEPMYFRIKLPDRCAWVRMRYRKRSLKISTMFDPIHLRSKQAVLNMMRAIAAQGDGKLDVAQPFEDKALQQLSEEQVSRNPVDTFSFQFDRNIHMADPAQGIR